MRKNVSHRPIGLNPVIVGKRGIENLIKFFVEARVIRSSCSAFMIQGDQNSFGGMTVKPVVQSEEKILHSGVGCQERLGYTRDIGER